MTLTPSTEIRPLLCPAADGIEAAVTDGRWSSGRCRRWPAHPRLRPRGHGGNGQPGLCAAPGNAGSSAARSGAAPGTGRAGPGDDGGRCPRRWAAPGSASFPGSIASTPPPRRNSARAADRRCPHELSAIIRRSSGLGIDMSYPRPGRAGCRATAGTRSRGRGIHPAPMLAFQSGRRPAAHCTGDRTLFECPALQLPGEGAADRAADRGGRCRCPRHAVRRSAALRPAAPARLHLPDADPATPPRHPSRGSAALIV